MKLFRWNTSKDRQLEAERGITFDRVVKAIQSGEVLDVIEHPNQTKYPSQKIFIIALDDYIYLVPFVENEQEIFLKTIIPSRKMKKRYLED
ncbi:MAG: toxin [Phormidesmis priestleyi]|uniref:Toxin n=1 Tax=Phormidesmis priestleyi TaxID=268141 RepID=A0A2W4XXI0_9CYAN|nr:MAG: toxin [Phormidesmis priestleyi]